MTIRLATDFAVHPRSVDGRKLALVIVLTSDDDFEESCCVVGRAHWDGRHLRVRTADGDTFLLPRNKLDQIRTVPATTASDFDGAEHCVVLDDLSPARETAGLRPAC